VGRWGRERDVGVEDEEGGAVARADEARGGPDLCLERHTVRLAARQRHVVVIPRGHNLHAPAQQRAEHAPEARGCRAERRWRRLPLVKDVPCVARSQRLRGLAGGGGARAGATGGGELGGVHPR